MSTIPGPSADIDRVCSESSSRTWTLQRPMFQCTKSGEKMQDEPESSEEYTHNYIYPLYVI